MQKKNSTPGKGTNSTPGKAASSKLTPSAAVGRPKSGKGKAAALVKDANSSGGKLLQGGKTLNGGKQVMTGRGNTSTKAGLQFGIPRIARFIKTGRYGDRVAGGAPVYMAALLQYITSEIIELAGSEVEKDHKKRINPRHVMMAIKKDVELNKLLGKGDFAKTGVLVHIAKEFLPHKGKKGKAVEGEDAEMEEE